MVIVMVMILIMMIMMMMIPMVVTLVGIVTDLKFEQNAKKSVDRL
jgi:hypothetical protein